MNDEQVVQHYLTSLKISLGALLLRDQEEIVREIAAHIADARAEGIAPVLIVAQLGAPQEIAAQYLNDRMSQRADQSDSSRLRRRGTLQFGTRSFAGVMVFCAGLFGYLLGAALILTSLLKPFFPGNVGLWHLERRPVLAGFTSQPQMGPMHEILGWWYIPAAFLLGMCLVISTTLFIRAISRWSRHLQERFDVQSAPAGTPFTA